MNVTLHFRRTPHAKTVYWRDTCARVQYSFFPRWVGKGEQRRDGEFLGACRNNRAHWNVSLLKIGIGLFVVMCIHVQKEKSLIICWKKRLRCSLPSLEIEWDVEHKVHSHLVYKTVFMTLMENIFSWEGFFHPEVQKVFHNENLSCRLLTGKPILINPAVNFKDSCVIELLVSPPLLNICAFQCAPCCFQETFCSLLCRDMQFQSKIWFSQKEKKGGRPSLQAQRIWTLCLNNVFSETMKFSYQSVPVVFFCTMESKSQFSKYNKHVQ